MKPPLPPPRPAFRSEAGSNGVTAETFFSALRGVDTKVDAIENKVDALASEIKLDMALARAGTKSETVKILVGAVVTLGLAVLGSRAVAPTPEPTKTEIVRSAFDRALDVCRSLEGDEAKTLCAIKMAHDSSQSPSTK